MSAFLDPAAFRPAIQRADSQFRPLPARHPRLRLPPKRQTRFRSAGISTRHTPAFAFMRQGRALAGRPRRRHPAASPMAAPNAPSTCASTGTRLGKPQPGGRRRHQTGSPWVGRLPRQPGARRAYCDRRGRQDLTRDRTLSPRDAAVTQAMPGICGQLGRQSAARKWPPMAGLSLPVEPGARFSSVFDAGRASARPPAATIDPAGVPCPPRRRRVPRRLCAAARPAPRSERISQSTMRVGGRGLADPGHPHSGLRADPPAPHLGRALRLQQARPERQGSWARITRWRIFCSATAFPGRASAISRHWARVWPEVDRRWRLAPLDLSRLGYERVAPEPPADRTGVI